MAERTGSVVAQEKVVTSVFDKTHDHAVIHDGATLDEATLAALGYKQQFKRVLGLLPSIASTIAYALGYSGTGGLIWGWLVAGIMIQSTAFSMAELCSSMPTAGGLYYASACLAPPGWGPVASWFVGWSNFCGFVTGPCSLNYALAYMITTAATISNPDYKVQNWHIYLIFLLILALNGLLAMQSTKTIGYMNVVGTVWNIFLVLIFIIWFPAVGKTQGTHEVWTTFENGTEWPIGWAVIMGFLTAIWTMSGYDAPFHLTEECSNSNIASPRAIVMTSQTGLYLGWAIVLVIAYTVTDITAVVAGDYGQPFGSLCLQVLGKKQGLAMFGLTMVGQFFCGLGCTCTVSRIVFAYSRDGALPFSKVWSHVDRRFNTPVNATWGILLVDALLGLLLFAGPVAINAVFSIGAIGQYTSFTIPIILKLFFDHGRFKPGPWNLGKFSKPLNIVAIGWWLLIVPALCFPAVYGSSLTLELMNWTCLIYGGSMTLAMCYYWISARKWFKGPKINVEHLQGDTLAAEDSHGSSEEPRLEGKKE